METTLFEIELNDGRIFRIFCRGKNQKNRFRQSARDINHLTKRVTEISNGIHTIKEFEEIKNNLILI